MYNVIFNRRGRTILAITDHIEDSDQVARYPNIVSFRQSKDILSVRLNIVSNLGNPDHLLRVYRVTFLNPEQMSEIAGEAVMKIYKHIPHANISMRANIAYFMTERTTVITDEQLKERMNVIFGDWGDIDISMDYLEYDLTSNFWHLFN
ncbi:MAG: hypothetical protein R3Y68_04085 [Rikenellaceae bacterium]